MPRINKFKINRNKMDFDVARQDEVMIKKLYKEIAYKKMLGLKSGVNSPSTQKVGYDLTVRPNTGSIATIDSTISNAIGNVSSGATTIVMDELVVENEVTFISSGVSLSTSAAIRMSIHPNGKFIAIASQISPYLHVHKYDNGVIGDKIADPSTPVPSVAGSVAFHPNGNFIAVTHGTPYASIYQFDSTTGAIGSLVSNSFGLTSTPTDIAFHPNGNLISISFGISPYFYVYPFNSSTGVVGTKVSNPSSLPDGSINKIVFNSAYPFIHLSNPSGTGGSKIISYQCNSTTGVLGFKAGNYFTLFQLNSFNSIDVHPSGEYVVGASTAYPFFEVYKIDTSNGAIGTVTLTKPTDLPSNTSVDCCFSSDGKYIIIGSSSPSISIYPFDYVNGVIGTRFQPSIYPASSTCRQVKMSPDGKYILLAYISTNNPPNVYSYSFTEGVLKNKEITIYDDINIERKIVSDVDLPNKTITLNSPLSYSYTKPNIARSSSRVIETSTKMNNKISMLGWRKNFVSVGKDLTPSLLSATEFNNSLPFTIGGSDFHPNGNFFGVSGSSPYIFIYPLNTTTGAVSAKVASPSVTPTGTAMGMAYHPNGNWVAFAHTTTPFLSVYPFDSSTGAIGTKIANPSVLPAGNGLSVAFHPNGNFIAVGHATTPYLSVYPFDPSTGAIGTKIANPATLPTPSVNRVVFHPNGNFIALGMGSSPYIHVYPFDSATGAIGIKVANPSSGLTNLVNSLMFHPNGSFIAVATTSSPFLTVYNFDSTTGAIGTKLTLPSVLPLASIRDIAFHPNGDVLMLAINAVSPTDTNVVIPYLFDKANGIIGEVLSFSSNFGKTITCNSLTFSPSGKYVVLAGTQSYSYIYSFKDDVVATSVLVEDFRYDITGLDSSIKNLTVYVEYPDIGDANYNVDASISSVANATNESYVTMRKDSNVVNGIKELIFSGDILDYRNVVIRFTITRSSSSYESAPTKLLVITK